MTSPVTASAPGSTLITGEHAVVYGHPCIVAAIDQRVQARVTIIDELRLRVTSEIADPLSADLGALRPEGPYRFVIAAVLARAPQTGLDITITSAIDPALGLGSSAAVTIATLGALFPADDKYALFARGLAIIRSLQGRGSGADLAASLWGGMISYQPNSSGRPRVGRLPPPPDLSLAYAGYKTPTGEVLALVAKRMEDDPPYFENLYRRMSVVASATIAAAEDADWTLFAQHLDTYQTLMEDLGVSDAKLEGLVASARRTPGTLAAKISGSGLGDCVLAIGAVPEGFFAAPLALDGLVRNG